LNNLTLKQTSLCLKLLDQETKQIFLHNNEPITHPKTSFTITVFFNILYQILSSLKDRFENLQNFNDTFGFIHNMFTLTEDELFKSCKDLHVKLQDDARGESDIDGMDLFNEIKSLKIHLQTSNSDHNFAVYI
jgi:hypothetical protein